MKNRLHPCLFHLFLLFIACFFLEFFLFNYHHWFSLSYNHNVSTQISFGEGITVSEDGQLILSDESSSYIEITCSPTVIKSLHLDIRRVENGALLPVRIEIQATDEGNAIPYSLPEATIYPEVGNSRYFSLHLAGQSERILLFFKENYGTRLQLNDISINPVHPLTISFFRLAAIFFISAALYIFWPQNGFYHFLCQPHCFWQKCVLILFAGMQIFLFWFLIQEANYSTNPADTPYTLLTQALANGHFDLDVKPAPSLLAMENPYDTFLREDSDVSFLWDYAYYEGHYYVYFGVTPVLLLYLPHYLLTGQALPQQANFFLYSILFTLGSLLLLWKIVTIYFKRTPFLIYLLASATFINGCGAFYLFAHPKFYSETNQMALVFAVWGLYFWISALHCTRKNKQIPLFMAGSLCIAFIAGCRPQMLLLCFLSIPLLWRFFLQKENRPMFLWFLLPLILFGLWIMYYNYARFESILDFGANYNLTSNDMTKRGFVLGRIPLGIFSYLLQPLHLQSQFPYIEEITVQSSYMGITISEGMYGGLLWTTPLTAFCFFLPALKHIFLSKRLWSFCTLSVAFGLILVVLDTEMAGILPRYYSDFSLFFLLAALFCLFAFLEHIADSPYRNRWILLPLVLCISGLIYQFFMIFADHDTNLNYVLFNKISYMLQFWK